MGYDILTYVLAIERIGEEDNSLRTFSTHTSIAKWFFRVVLMEVKRGNTSKNS
jgi:hypothetical protein